MNKKLMATAITASTLGGAVAGAALLAPGQAGAQEGDSVAPAEETVRPDFATHVEEALQGLVDDGTLTPAQVDAVVDALAEARPESRPGHRGGGGRGLGEDRADIAGLLGMDGAELRDAIMSGQSVADIAADQGVDVQTIVDAIVDAAEDRVNGAVEAGRIEQDKADEILANAEQHAQDLVNGELERPHFGERGGFEGAPPADA